MGYYTHHNLTCKPDHTTLPDNDLFAQTGAAEEFGADNLAELIESIGDDEPTKWYDHEQDMRQLALLYPDVTWRLTGDGEEQGDLWVEFYHGVQYERHQAPAWTPPEAPSWQNK